MVFRTKSFCSPPVVLRFSLAVACAALLSGCYCSLYATSGCLEIADLEELGREGQSVELIEKLSDERSWVREETARILGQRRVKSAIGALSARLTDTEEQPWVRAAAARALADMADPAAGDVVVEVARTVGTPAELDLALIEAVCTTVDRERGQSVLQSYSDHEDALVAAMARYTHEQGGCGL